MKCIDLFCGCGGLSLGFEQAGYEPINAVPVKLAKFVAETIETYRKEGVRKELSLFDFTDSEDENFEIPDNALHRIVAKF